MFSTKIHELVDSRGRPHYLAISPGQAHYISRAENLLRKAKGRSFIGDRAYHSSALFLTAKNRGMKFIVPCKSIHLQKKRHDAFLYLKRVNVKWFFHRLKRFRSVATRYCKTAKPFLSCVQIASIVILAN